MTTFVHTRSNFPKPADIITLVEYLKNIYFTQAMYWICQVCGFEYYSTYKKDIDTTEDPCLTWLKSVEPDEEKEKYEALRIIDENELRYFDITPHIKFLNDGVSYKVQQEFEIGYSLHHDRIIIPIRDEMNNLVGIKGRTIFDDYEERDIYKFIAIYHYPKTRILYGLNKALSYIKEKGEVIVFEAEKAPLQMWSMGIKNCVGGGGHDLSMHQVMMLERLGVSVVLAYDKGITREDIKKERNKFVIPNLYAIWDKDDVLNDKDSPSDKGRLVWDYLYDKHRYKIR